MDGTSQIDGQSSAGSGGGGGGGGSVADDDAKGTPKRLHVSNIPFRFRDPDLRQMFGVRRRSGVQPRWTPRFSLRVSYIFPFVFGLCGRRVPFSKGPFSGRPSE